MRIGVGITTYERFDRFKECMEHLLKNRRDVSEILIVDDASVKDRELYDIYFEALKADDIKIVVKEKNKGVGNSKNLIMKHFYEGGFDYFFTLEDDINIKSPKVFKAYIDAAKASGIDYLNFAFHGELNKGKEFDKQESIVHYPHIVGAFTMYTPELIEKIGYHDEAFLNAWEHVDYAYRCTLVMPDKYKFWKFADIIDSGKYLEEQLGAIDDSSIRPRDDWKFNIQMGDRYFLAKHGKFVRHIPR